jgi:GNAT superfamily N-acetyltransferase
MSEITLDEIRGTAAETQFAALEDLAFAVPPPGHYLDDFPVWDPAKAVVGTVFRLGAFDGEKLAGACGVRLAELRFPLRAVTVALIGAVATASEYRGRGFATQLVTLAVQWATQRGAVAALLWGSEHQLYGKIGFGPCGTQATLPLSGIGGGSSEKVSTGWTPGILTALKSRRSGLIVRDVDRSWLSSHKNVRWYWTGSAQQVSAYAALGRGIDLSHFVHEWGGERSALISIFQQIAQDDPYALLLGSPTVFKHYGLQHDSATEERLALVRVIDAMALFEAVHSDSKFTALFEKGEWKLSLTDRSRRVSNASLGPLEMSQLLFGPVPAALKKPWADYFPLPLWCWGLDAV